MYYLWLGSLCSINLSIDDPLGLGESYPNGYWVVMNNTTATKSQVDRWYYHGDK